MRKLKNKKNKKIVIICLIICFVILTFLGILYYITSTVNNYSYVEKNWINENASKTFDVYIPSSLPIFSNNGTGVFYDYLTALSSDTGLSFNILTTDTTSIKMTNSSSLNSKDIIFYKDHYVVVSTGEVLNKLDDLNKKTVGIMKEDESTVGYYLTDYKEVNSKTYETFDNLISAYTSKEIDYIIIPMYKYLDKLLSLEYQIVYHLDGLYSYYTLSVNKDLSILEGIMKKFYSRWEEKSKERINEYFLDIYYKAKNYTELQKDSITSEDFIVGYISNLPFEGMIRGKFTGITSTYLDKFSDISGVTYKYVEYENTKELNKALKDKKVDIVLNYYSLSNDKYDNTRILGSTDYVVIADVDNNVVVNSLYGLVNSEIVMLANMNLKYNMASQNLFEIKDYNSIKSMAKNVDKDTLIIVEKEVYDYYKDSYLEDYSIRYMDNVRLNNSFLLNKDNSSFNKLFDFYLSTLSSSEIKNESVEDVIVTIKDNPILNFIVNNVLYIIIVIILIILGIYYLLKKLTTVKKTKNEERLYYFDTMTNLKNRNYLNDNIDFWNSSKVYPQTIIVLDINNLKLLNDRKGHEVGDNQIKAVANVLIKTQRDNSEIMRTDGDEFLVYLVGYEDKQISSYIHKLNKELNNSLPDKDYGVSLGYSSIKDELTTIDDAISEAIMMIKKNKGK